MIIESLVLWFWQTNQFLVWFLAALKWKLFAHFEVCIYISMDFLWLLPLYYFKNYPQYYLKIYSTNFRQQNILPTTRICQAEFRLLWNKILLLQETIVLFESEYWCLLQVDSSFYFWLPISFGKKKDIFSGLVPADLIRETPCHSHKGKIVFGETFLIPASSRTTTCILQKLWGGRKAVLSVRKQLN